ncbi:arsenite methyltransferase [Chloroflexota bacterium]
MKEEEIKQAVREGYAKIAKEGSPCCCPASSCCCSASSAQDIDERAGYGKDEQEAIPEGANLGLGCGNPVALASLKEGETVLDLGSGAGVDCFLAASKVGKTGKVVGVDMTPEMLERARENAIKGNYPNIEFRLGEIENLPVADGSVDVIISNCVINLSPDKERVFKETFRVLKPGGRLMVSDIVLLKELPDSIKNSIEAHVGCVSGAMPREEYLRIIASVGFEQVSILNESAFSLKWLSQEASEISDSVISINVQGIKPKG